MAHIVLVEDETPVRKNLMESLLREGFVVEALTDVEEARARCQHPMPELVMLGVSLNGDKEAGFHLCQDLRLSAPSLPIIFLAHPYRKADHITSLRLGADDYLAKDVSRDLLAVRIRALIRRAETLSKGVKNSAATILDELVIHRKQMAASWKGMALRLNINEYRVLTVLISEPGRMWTCNELAKETRQSVECNTVTAQIMRLRKSFLKMDPGFDRIRTERGRGYRWVG